MKELRIELSHGERKDIWKYGDIIHEDEINAFVEWRIRTLAKKWEVTETEIEVEIIYVKRLK